MSASTYTYAFPAHMRTPIATPGTTGAVDTALAPKTINRGGPDAEGYSGYDLGVVSVDLADSDAYSFMSYLFKEGGAVLVSNTGTAINLVGGENTAFPASDWTSGLLVTGDTGGVTFYINKNASGEANRLLGPYTVGAGTTHIFVFPSYLYEFSLYLEVTSGTFAAPSYIVGEDWA